MTGRAERGYRRGRSRTPSIRWEAALEPLTFDALDRADSVWNRLAARAPHPDPLCCRTEWQFSYHQAFAPRRRLYFRGDGDGLVALAGTPHRRVGTLLEPLESHWLFGCPLLGPGAVEVFRALLEEEAFRARPPAVALSGLTPASPAWHALLAALRPRYRVRLGEPSVVRSASLAGGLDGYLSRRSANHRRKLRQAERRAAAAGFTFERSRPADPAAAAGIYDRMLAVEERSWKGLGRCGMAEPPSREFYRAMLCRLSASAAGRVIFARRDGRDVGFVFGGVACGHYRGQQFSFDAACSPWSVGNLLQLEQVRWLAEEGVERYDLGPCMEYKAHWAECEERTETLVLLPRG